MVNLLLMQTPVKLGQVQRLLTERKRVFIEWLLWQPTQETSRWWRNLTENFLTFLWKSTSTEFLSVMKFISFSSFQLTIFNDHVYFRKSLLQWKNREKFSFKIFCPLHLLGSQGSNCSCNWHKRQLSRVCSTSHDGGAYRGQRHGGDIRDTSECYWLGCWGQQKHYLFYQWRKSGRCLSYWWKYGKMIGAIKFVFICNASVGFTFMFMYEQIV